MTPRDVLALAPALALDEESLAREATKITQQSSAIHIWTACWILTMIVLTWWISRMAIEDNTLFRELYAPTMEGWPYFRNLIYVFTLSQFIWIDIALARRLGKLLEEHARVNLLDRSGLRALVKRTRRSVLLWVPLLVHSIGLHNCRAHDSDPPRNRHSTAIHRRKKPAVGKSSRPNRRTKRCCRRRQFHLGIEQFT